MVGGLGGRDQRVGDRRESDQARILTPEENDKEKKSSTLPIPQAF
jgi:hypothetical protein